jgi:hypothetical protein
VLRKKQHWKSCRGKSFPQFFDSRSSKSAPNPPFTSHLPGKNRGVHGPHGKPRFSAARRGFPWLWASFEADVCYAPLRLKSFLLNHFQKSSVVRKEMASRLLKEAPTNAETGLPPAVS